MSFLVDNRTRENESPQRENEAQYRGCMQDSTGVRSRWQILKIVYNSSRTEHPVFLEGEGWMVLCDGKNSRLWESDHLVAGEIKAAPQSVLILGLYAGAEKSAAEGRTSENCGTKTVAEDMEKAGKQENTWRKKAV